MNRPGYGDLGSSLERDYAGKGQAQQASVIDEAQWREEKERAMYEQTMLSSWNTLCQAAKIRRDHVLMGDIKRWLEKKRGELDAEIREVGL